MINEVMNSVGAIAQRSFWRHNASSGDQGHRAVLRQNMSVQMTRGFGSRFDMVQERFNVSGLLLAYLRGSVGRPECTAAALSATKRQERACPLRISKGIC